MSKNFYCLFFIVLTTSAQDVTQYKEKIVESKEEKEKKQVAMNEFLFSAAKSDQPSSPIAIRRMIEVGANLFAINTNNENPLEVAKKFKRTENIELLEKLGALVQVSTDKNVEKFFNAVKNGDFATMELLKNKIPNINIGFEKNGSAINALMLAAIRNKPDVVTWLLKQRANPNLRSINAFATALMFAIHKNNSDVIKLLLPVSDLSMQEGAGQTAIDFVVGVENPLFESKKLFDELNKTDPQLSQNNINYSKIPISVINNAFLKIAKNPNQKAMIRLIQNIPQDIKPKLNFNITDYFNRTPFMILAGSKFNESYNILLDILKAQHGLPEKKSLFFIADTINPSIQDKLGRTASDYAVLEKQPIVSDIIDFKTSQKKPSSLYISLKNFTDRLKDLLHSLQ